MGTPFLRNYATFSVYFEFFKGCGITPFTEDCHHLLQILFLRSRQTHLIHRFVIAGIGINIETKTQAH
ncbi:Uncharacterised protein [Shigella flexneri]|nr:Uncharacterised protein [Shigella flexneri]